MTSFTVLDCSAVMAFLFREPGTESVDRIMDEYVEGKITILVPALFWFETANGLRVGVRRGRLSEIQAADLRSKVASLGFLTDPPPSLPVLQRMDDWARRHHLTVYDSAYVELAQRHRARLKTLDSDLLRLRREYDWIV